MKTVLALCPCWSVNAPSLTLATLAACLRRAGHDVAVRDLNFDLYTRVSAEHRQHWTGVYERSWQQEATFERLPFLADGVFATWADDILAERPGLVCLSLFTTNTRASLKLAAALKAREAGVRICIGGPDAYRSYGTGALVQAEPFDFMCLGEAEIPLADLVSDLERGGCGDHLPGIVAKRADGTLAGGEESPLVADLDSLAFPDYGGCGLDGRTEPGLLPISWARGCVGRCAFCFEVAFWRNTFRQKSVEYLVREFQHDIARYGIRRFQFNDSLVNGHMGRLGQLCDRLIEERADVEWRGLARVHAGMTVPFVEKLVKAGCRNLMYGIESASQKVLDLMNKGVSAALANRVIEDSYRGGLKPGVSLLVGFPGEGQAEFQETVDFVRKNGKYLSFVNIAGLGIMPFTPVDRARDRLGVHFDNSVLWTTGDGRNSIVERNRRIRSLAQAASEHVEQVNAYELPVETQPTPARRRSRRSQKGRTMVFDYSGDALIEQLFVDESTPTRMSIYHVQAARYAFFARHVHGKTVLDSGCGSGNQCRYLKEAGAASVTGIDLNARAIEHARRAYGGPGIDFVLGDVVSTGLPDAAFDVVVSGEMIEHLPADRQLPYLQEVRRLLRDDGLLLLSTPNRASSTGGPFAYHEKELAFGELDALIRQAFPGFAAQYYRLLPVDGYLFHAEAATTPPLEYLAIPPKVGDRALSGDPAICPPATFFVTVVSREPQPAVHELACGFPRQPYLGDLAVEELAGRMAESRGLTLLQPAIAELFCARQPHLSLEILEPLLAGLQACPQLAEHCVRYQVGTARLALEDFTGAAHAFAAILATDGLPAAFERATCLALGQAALAVPDLAQAAFTIERLADLEPTGLDAYRLAVLRGRLAEAQGALGAAEEHFVEAKKACPNRIEAYLHLAAFYRQRGRYDAAFVEIDRLLKPQMYHDCSAVYLEKAAIHEAQANRGAAEAAYRTALRLDPADFHASYRLGRLVAVVDARRALPYLDRAARLRPSRADIRFELARQMLRADNREAAAVELARLVDPGTGFVSYMRRDPDLVGAIIQTVSLIRGTHPRLALDLLALAQQVAPDHQVLLYARGSVFEAQGETDRAIDAFERVLAVATADGRDPAIVGGAHFHLGEIWWQRGEPTRAQTAYRECLAILPDHARCRERLDEAARGARC